MTARGWLNCRPSPAASLILGGEGIILWDCCVYCLKPIPLRTDQSMQLDFREDPSLLQSIVDVMPHGLFTVDAEGRFVAWSAGAERITGYRAEDVIGQPCRLLEGPNCKGFGHLAEMLKSKDTPCGGICDQECKILAKDGREVFIHGSVRMLNENDGPNQGAVGSFSDVTSLVQANERIALLERSSTHREAFERLVALALMMTLEL